MAHADLSVVPREAGLAFVTGDELRSLTLLRREQSAHPASSLEWAQLERLIGLLLVHLQREVEGTFCLERADARLDSLGASKPDLTALEARSGVNALESLE